MTTVRVDPEALLSYALRARLASHEIMANPPPEVPSVDQASAVAVAALHESVAANSYRLARTAQDLATDTEMAAQGYTSVDAANATDIGGVL